MSQHSIPPEILHQHIAILGKTGSGKSSTAKLAVEQVVREGARVCVLDPIKSDWWGLTSSVDGKRAGLPFHILGGPRGHVPLHPSAGKAIAEIVANGSLPLSIIDMADFEPGGQAKFFVDFASTLLRKMRGVVYLVIEEAHLFAPKERSGIGAENLSIHWAKTLATAGRSKGIRIILATQRTQALHNALLGSCDTLIAHRLTAPADQEPVVKWLKANTNKDVLEKVSGSLASLKTGQGWICSGEAKIFELVSFSRIKTYDNTATPTGDGEIREIKTAPVDQDKLRAIIGEAVDIAKADDPRELRRQVADLKRQLESKAAAPLPTAKTVDKPVLTDADRALLEKMLKSFMNMVALIDGRREWAVRMLEAKIRETDEYYAKRIGPLVDGKLLQFQKILDKLQVVSQQSPVTTFAGHRAESPARASSRRSSSAAAASNNVRRAGVPSVSGNPSNDAVGTGGLRRMLIALAQRNGLTARQLGLRAGIAVSGGSFGTYLSRGRTNGWITGDRNQLEITQAGVDALGTYDPLPEGRDLLAYWLTELGDGGASRMLRALAEIYPKAMSREELGQATNIAVAGGSFGTYLSRLRTLELIEGRGELRASEELFT
jgi:hypothetical protein